jgi:hypothetical protein
LRNTRDAAIDQLVEVVRQHLTAQTHRDALTALRQQQRELHRQEDRLLVPAVVAQLPFGGLRVEDHIVGELAQACFDVTRCRRAIAGECVPPVPLAVDQQVLLPQLHQRIADAGITVRMVLHGMPDDVRHLVVAAIIEVLHAVQDPPLHRLQSIIQGRYGTLQDHIARIVQEPVPVHTAHTEGARIDRIGLWLQEQGAVHLELEDLPRDVS